MEICRLCLHSNRVQVGSEHPEFGKLCEVLQDIPRFGYHHTHVRPEEVTEMAILVVNPNQ